MTESEKCFILVREGATNAIVAKVDVTGKSMAFIDGVVDGLRAFTDKEKHYIDDAEAIVTRLREVWRHHA